MGFVMVRLCSSTAQRKEKEAVWFGGNPRVIGHGSSTEDQGESRIPAGSMRAHGEVAGLPPDRTGGDADRRISGVPRASERAAKIGEMELAGARPEP